MESDWVREESKTRPGKFYYYNKVTQKSQWKTPKELSPKHEHVKVSVSLALP